jgi:hypothetical protein
MSRFRIVLSLAFHILLSGSILLPVILIVRWGASKWRALHRLTSNRNRWVLIWGFYGFVEMALKAALFLWGDYRGNGHLTFIPLDFLGWAGSAIEMSLYTFTFKCLFRPFSQWVLLL